MRDYVTGLSWYNYSVFLIDSIACLKIQVVDMKRKIAEYYDSIGGDNEIYWKKLQYFTQQQYIIIKIFCTEHLLIGGVIVLGSHIKNG